MIARDERGMPTAGARVPRPGLRSAALVAEGEAPAPPGTRTRVELELGDLGRPHGWRVEPGSPRPGALAPTATYSGRRALHIELGRGHGAPIHVGRSLRPPLPAQAVCLRCYALTAGDAPVSLGLALRLAPIAEQGLPVLACAPVPVPLRRKAVLAFDLGDLGDLAGGHAAEMDAGAASARIVLELHTTAREGFVVLERVVMW